MLTEEEQDDLFDKIRLRVVTVFSLSLLLYDDIVSGLQAGLFEGFGGGLDRFDNQPSKKALLERLNINIHRLSAAKNFQQTNDMANFILDDKGFIRSFNDFKKDVKPIFDKYNDTWFKAEFDTIVAQGQAASQWVDIQNNKETLPLLEYQTADDEKVRPQHAAWDDIVRTVDDPFWNRHFPPNGFNCRCIVKQLSEGTVTSIASVDKLPSDDIFALNFGKDEFVFKTTGAGPHPYFKAPANLKRNNFGLPLP